MVVSKVIVRIIRKEGSIVVGLSLQTLVVTVKVVVGDDIIVPVMVVVVVIGFAIG